VALSEVALAQGIGAAALCARGRERREREAAVAGENEVRVTLGPVK